jgi:mono/diheme cytochrome c family protein
MHRTSAVAPTVLIVALLLAACVTTAAPVPSKSVDAAYVPADVRAEQGHRYAQHVCARCHAVEAQGQSPNAASPPFTVLATRYDVVTLGRKLDDIATGHYEMPPTHVSDDEIAGLTAYLQRLAGR